MNEAKTWYASKTLWVNLVALIVGVLGYLLGQDVVQEYPAIVAAFVAVQGALNVILRMVTSQSIK